MKGIFISMVLCFGYAGNAFAVRCSDVDAVDRFDPAISAFIKAGYPGVTKFLTNGPYTVLDATESSDRTLIGQYEFTYQGQRLHGLVMVKENEACVASVDTPAAFTMELQVK